jgi:small GTP-binding protein
MGNALTWVSSFWYGEKFVALLGLDGAGKTSLVDRLKLGDIDDPLPTMGFKIDNLVLHNSMLQIVDVAGQDKMRVLWGALYHSADGIIYMIDGNDIKRLSIAMCELKRVMEYPSLKDKPFLILVNKHDINAVDVKLLKHQIQGDRWRAFNVSVKTGEGLDEALMWFTNNVF